MKNLKLIWIKYCEQEDQTTMSRSTIMVYCKRLDEPSRFQPSSSSLSLNLATSAKEFAGKMRDDNVIKLNDKKWSATRILQRERKFSLEHIIGKYSN